MRQKHAARRLWPVLVASTLGLIAYGALCPSKVRLGGHSSEIPMVFASETTDNKAGFDNLHLTVEQCQAAFPGLTKEIDSAVAQGSFQLSVADASVSLLGQIKDNKILIIRAPRPVDMSDQWKERQRAALHQIHRAILTSPSRLPDTVFNLYIQDTPVSNSWSHSRPAISSSPRHIFPIPHFAFWAWDQPFIRSIPQAAAATDDIEAALSFAKKDRRAVWRGTAWFNNGASANPRSRQDLIRMTKDAKWADVQALEWTNNGENATNALRIEDFCRHKYIIHTEGVSYSGRLQFHQLCESVIISPPIEWLQHTTHLVKPVYSSVLLSGGKEHPIQHDLTKKQSQYPSARTQETWPATVRPEEANMVFVNPDWSDLDATISWLEDHQEVARGIAQRQRALFVGRGYLSPAAEVCYWRALIRGWSQVTRADKAIWENAEAVSWEEFSVRPDSTQKRP
ncbi:DUF821 domain-containing protein [Colletotrichum truncatum]|uniref:DUF821 domain-containing protein n=1 Tax=Colletotrichum truncatum TaxID=5467 RepID=A0ACC3ZEP2_COLTU|nr:duf821 domain-containing protein [Colletotrichum truncatum]KAF6801468.1 duf821 domain-containing protein [Colletotrichum truncatum]